MTLRDLSDMVYDAMEELGLDPEGDPEDMNAVEVTVTTEEGSTYLTLAYEGDKVSFPLDGNILDLPVLH